MQSDHSKLIISDAFTSFPKMILGSKNLTDFGAAINFDEILRIDGPAAGATALSYIPDVELAFALAQDEKKISPLAFDLVNAWLVEAHGRRTGTLPAVAEPMGTAEVRIAENNGDDSVRNVEHTIINLLESAKKSVKFYGLGMLPYNLEFTKAIARAIRRGVEVLTLLNSRLGIVVGLSFLDQVREFGAGANMAESHSRWRVLLPVKSTRDGWPSLDQQQHTKTILVDDETLFLGSANFDAATFEGAFREFSVAVRNTDAVSQALHNFDSVFENANLTLPANVFVAEKENRLANFSEAARNAAILNYLRIRGARVKLVEAEKTLPCGF